MSKVPFSTESIVFDISIVRSTAGHSRDQAIGFYEDGTPPHAIGMLILGNSKRRNHTDSAKLQYDVAVLTQQGTHTHTHTHITYSQLYFLVDFLLFQPLRLEKTELDQHRIVVHLSEPCVILLTGSGV